jgi:signal peptidase I
VTGILHEAAGDGAILLIESITGGAGEPAGIMVSGARLLSPMPSRARTLLREIVPVLVAMAVVLATRSSLADHYRVPTGSMEPTVQIGDQVCVSKIAYGLRAPVAQTYLARGKAPARGDVVVLASPTDGEVLLKRVVAVPGDLVEVTGGRVAIDGVLAPVRVQDGDLVEEIGVHAHALGVEYGGGPDFGPTRVPADRFLVLGDNRGNSRDGRFFGWVDREAILGRAMAVCVRGGRPVWHSL